MTSSLQHDPHGISTHALREEGDISETGSLLACPEFLPTPSVRRATELFPRQEPPEGISTHALREEGDSRGPSLTSPLEVFLPTPSVRRATTTWPPS